MTQAREARAEAASFSGALEMLRVLRTSDFVSLALVYVAMSSAWVAILRAGVALGAPGPDFDFFSGTPTNRHAFLVGLGSAAARLACVAMLYGTAVGLILRRRIGRRVSVARGLLAAAVSTLLAWAGYLCCILPGVLVTARAGASTPLAFREGLSPLSALGESVLRTDGSGGKYLGIRAVLILPILIGTCLITTVTEHDALAPMWQSLGRFPLLSEVLWSGTLYLPELLYVVFVAALDVHLDDALRPGRTAQIAETFE